MLRRLRIHNFRTYLNTDLEFTRRHLIIGRNNSGKTNLCAALCFLRKTASSDLATAAQDVPGGIAEITNWAFDSDTVELRCECEIPFDGKPYVYSYDLELRVETSGTTPQEGQPAFRVTREQLILQGPEFRKTALLWSDGREAKMLHEEDFVRRKQEHRVTTPAPRDATMLSKLYELDSNPRAVFFRRYLASWLFFSLSPDRIRFGWRGNSTVSALSTRGDNLASMLFQLKNFDERRYRNVIDHVRMVEPDLEAINFYPVPDQGAVPFVALRNNPRASWNGLSDGTLRCLALALIAEIVAGPSGLKDRTAAPLVVIEEPENGIYPGQLRAVFDLFDERAGRGQFLFTSHSPYFINFFDGCRGSVTLLRRKKGITKIVPVPPPEDDEDRPLLAEQYSMELFD